MRAFVGLALDEAATLCLMNLQSGLHDVRWLDPNDFHLTLAFLGEISAEQRSELELQLDALVLNEVEIQIDGLGCFERNGKTQAAWASVADDQALSDLALCVRKAAKMADIDCDPAKFRPHVTLARFGKRPISALDDWIKHRADQARASCWCQDFGLYSSSLKPSGARYRLESSFGLQSFEQLWTDEPAAN